MRGMFGWACLLLVISACGNGLASGDSVPDGQWELVQLEYDGRVFNDPVILSSQDQLFGGRGPCNSFGQQADGEIVQTLVGCDEELGRIDAALVNAIQGERRLDGDQLVLDGSFATAELRAITLPTPEELFAILASDAPDVDPNTVLYDEEGGPPEGWDRIIRLDDGDEIAEFIIGTLEGRVCFHIGLDTEPVTSGSTCQSIEDVRFAAITMTAGFPEPLVQAALIPDAFLTEDSVAMLSSLGSVSGNVFRIDPSDSVEITLNDESGNSYLVMLR